MYLKLHCAYIPFRKNAQMTDEKILRWINFPGILSSTFVWSGTPERFHFWNRVNGNWVKIYRKFLKLKTDEIGATR